ncbi:FHA domain-containing protein [Salinibacterium sp. SYSU T00001]|uniref:FHA domain-containing protein n=1 Tax=Homoserinimonas sedimenticola TaxID=2986805 RepID=UPI0022356E9F|nr:FHA domain-containing protein [Salinibacterium sedimenticola]MCW4384911.1 FHA domain-containing protein [Salinibacterium sedimenticola]
MTGDDANFVVPPAPVTPPPTARDAAAPAPPDESEFISLPPGMANFDSATYRVETPRRSEPVVAKEAPVFVPTVAPGLPPQLPTAEVDDATRVAPSRQPSWTIDIAGSGQRRLTHGSLLLGRDPAALPEWPSAELLAVDDPQRSVSKTHAALVAEASGALLIHDLNSTNGVWLSYPNGDEVDVVPGTPHPVENGATIHLGEFEIRAQRG